MNAVKLAYDAKKKNAIPIQLSLKMISECSDITRNEGNSQKSQSKIYSSPLAWGSGETYGTSQPCAKPPAIQSFRWQDRQTYEHVHPYLDRAWRSLGGYAMITWLTLILPGRSLSTTNAQLFDTGTFSHCTEF